MLAKSQLNKNVLDVPKTSSSDMSCELNSAGKLGLNLTE